MSNSRSTTNKRLAVSDIGTMITLPSPVQTRNQQKIANHSSTYTSWIQKKRG